MKNKIPTIGLDTNIYSEILNYHYNLVHRRPEGVLNLKLKKIHDDIMDGRVKLAVTTTTQEEMIQNYGMFRQFIRFLWDANANLVPCATNNLLEEIRKHVYPVNGERVFLDVKTKIHRDGRKTQEINARYSKKIEEAREDMLEFYKKERARAAEVKSKIQYQQKRDLVVLLCMHHINKGIMTKNNVFDTFNLAESEVYGIDEFYTLNRADYERVIPQELNARNEEFITWFENNHEYRLQKAHYRLLSNLINVNKVNSEINYDKLMERLYTEFGIKEAKDGKHPRFIMKLRIPRLAEEFGITKDNFRTRILEIGSVLTEYELSPDSITNTEVKMMYK